MSEVKMKTYEELVKEKNDIRERDLQYIRANLDKYKKRIAKHFDSARIHVLEEGHIFNIDIERTDTDSTHINNRELWCSEMQKFLKSNGFDMRYELGRYSYWRCEFINN